MSRWPETWTCKRIREHIETFLDEQLPEASLRAIGSHLDDCGECAAHAQLAREIRTELQALPEIDAPAPVLQKILDQTVRAQSARPFWSRLEALWPQPAWGALAAVALALALGLGVLTQPSSDPAQPDPESIAQATAEARYALAKAGLFTRKAGRVIRDQTLRDQIVAPTTRGFSQALGGGTTKGVDDV